MSKPPFGIINFAVDEPEGGPTQGQYRQRLAETDLHVSPYPDLHVRSYADTQADLDAQSAINDPRLRKAIDAAAQVEHPEQGRKITQVLAGGTQLVHRLYPPEGTHTTNSYSPAASAVLRAAGDLRRVGMPNPIPRWAIEGAAPGYLDHPARRPPEQWLAQALDEATESARLDDPLIGIHALDIHHHGVPALTPHWYTHPDGTPREAYDLHDYMLQDHLARYARTPPPLSFWDVLTQEPHPQATAHALAVEAAHRGHLTAATVLIRPHADRVGRGLLARFLEELIRQGDVELLAELRARAHAEVRTNATSGAWLPGHDVDDAMTWSLYRSLFRLAVRGNCDALGELCSSADTGDPVAGAHLGAVLAYMIEQGDEAALAEARDRVDAGQTTIDYGLFLLPLLR